MDIAVIGAGMSAAGFYSSIDDSSVNMIFFDKGRGFGGRMSRRHIQNIGEFDHGAQFLQQEIHLLRRRSRRLRSRIS